MSCWIILENSPEIYTAGSNVEGKVVCTFKDKTSIRGAKVKLIGREHTSWKRKRNVYSGDHVFMAMEKILVDEGFVGCGTLEYRFQFILPHNCASSFENRFGKIDYFIKATIEVPWGDEENELAFHVLSPVDLNTIVNLNTNPIKYEDEKELCCGCCSSGPITLDIYLDREVFILGETMRIKVYCLNMSNRNIKKLRITLKLIIKSIAIVPQYKSEKTEEILTILHESGVEAKCDRHYDLELVIPKNCTIPNFNNCKLFDQWCNLIIEAKLPFPHQDFKVTNDIILGETPIKKISDLTEKINKRIAYGFTKSVITPPYPIIPIRMPVPTSMPTSTSMSMPSPLDTNKLMNIPISLLTSSDVPYFPGQSTKNSIVPYPSGDRMSF